jgi:hypothetical protein
MRPPDFAEEVVAEETNRKTMCYRHVTPIPD